MLTLEQAEQNNHVNVHRVVFWVVSKCSLLAVHHLFGKPNCVYFQTRVINVMVYTGLGEGFHFCMITLSEANEKNGQTEFSDDLRTCMACAFCACTQGVRSVADTSYSYFRQQSDITDGSQ